MSAGACLNLADQVIPLGLEITPRSDLDMLIYAALLYSQFPGDFDDGGNRSARFAGAIGRQICFLEKRCGTTVEELGLSWICRVTDPQEPLGKHDRGVGRRVS